jgi:ABC-type glutathione transport system ATPase component
MADRVMRMRSGRIVETRRNERRLPPGELAW